MLEFITNQYGSYPDWQAKGFAARFAFPFAQLVCTGTGYDIGCNRLEWAFPGATPIDPALEGCEWDAYNLPKKKVDYILSSHCLEHLPNWVEALDYWASELKKKGTLFLYLPHPDQQYWRPYNNTKHVHVLQPQVIKDYLEARGCWTNIIVTDCPDPNHSFYVIARKK